MRLFSKFTIFTFFVLALVHVCCGQVNDATSTSTPNEEYQILGVNVIYIAIGGAVVAVVVVVLGIVCYRKMCFKNNDNKPNMVEQELSTEDSPKINVADIYSVGEDCIYCAYPPSKQSNK